MLAVCDKIWKAWKTETELTKFMVQPFMKMKMSLVKEMRIWMGKN